MKILVLITRKMQENLNLVTYKRTTKLYYNKLTMKLWTQGWIYGTMEFYRNKFG